MKTKAKQVLTIFTVICILLTSIPIPAYAVELKLNDTSSQIEAALNLDGQEEYLTEDDKTALIEEPEGDSTKIPDGVEMQESLRDSQNDLLQNDLLQNETSQNETAKSETKESNSELEVIDEDTSKTNNTDENTLLNSQELTEFQNIEINWNDYFNDQRLITILIKYFEKLYPDTVITMEHILEVTELTLGNQSYFSDLTGISIFKNLTVLNLDDTGIYDLPPEIGELEHLRELSLLNCSINYLPEEVANLTNLTILRFGGYNTYHYNLGIELIPNLEELEIKNCQYYMMHHEIEFFKRLKVLRLSEVNGLDIQFIIQEMQDTQVFIKDIDYYFPDIQFIVDDINLSYIWFHEMPPYYLRDFLLERPYQALREFIEIQQPFSMPHEYIIAGVAREGIPVNYFPTTGEYNLTYMLEEYESENITLNNIRYTVRVQVDVRVTKTPEQMFPDPVFRAAIEEQLIMQYGEARWEMINYIYDLPPLYDCEDYTGISYLVGLKGLNISDRLLNANIEEIMKLYSIQHLTITSDYELQLPMELRDMTYLRTLNIISKSDNLPDVIGEMVYLEELYLSMPNLISVPEEVFLLRNLKYLNFYSGKFTELPSEIENLRKLEVLGFSNINLVRFPEEIKSLTNLQTLSLSSMKMETLPENIGEMENLKSLNIYSWASLNQLPAEIENLTNLEYLYISSCSGLSQFPEEIGSIPNLKSISLRDVGLQSLTGSFGNLRSLTNLRIENGKLQQLPAEIGNLQNLNSLLIKGTPLLELPDSIEHLNKLHTLELDSLKLEHLPETLGNLQNLQKLIIKNTSIVDLPESIGDFANLKTLELESNKSLYNLPASIGNLPKLEVLKMRSGSITELPASIGNLRSLKEFDFSSVNITTFPEEIGNIETLERISIWGGKLKELPDSINGLEKLRSIYISNAKMTEALPDLLFRIGYCSIGRQNVTLDPVSIPLNKSVTCDALIPPMLKQIKEKNNNILTGTWTITNPSQQTTTIPAGDGSELSAEMFRDLGDYKIFYESSKSDYTPSYKFGGMSVYQLQYTIPLAVTEEEENTINRIFPDAALAQIIADMLGKDMNEAVTEEELASIKNVQASQKGIADLTGIDRLVGVTHLTLSKNQISELPESLWTLTNLKLLDLQSNEIIVLSEGIENLTSLTALYVQKNKLSSLPEGISNLTALKTFYAQDNALVQAIPESCFLIRSGNYTKQSAALPNRILSAEAELNYNWFLPEFVLQLKQKNGGSLIGEWMIKNPSGTTVRIPAVDGSEIVPTLFTVQGDYTIQYNLAGSSYSVENGNIGTLNYSTKLTVE